MVIFKKGHSTIDYLPMMLLVLACIVLMRPLIVQSVNAPYDIVQVKDL